MGRPAKDIKAERKFYTLTDKAAKKLDTIPKGKKSAFVSAAIEHFTPIPNGNGGFKEEEK